jgi:hypothetical protein
MALVTSLGSTFLTTGGNETVVATPAIGDLIVVICASSGRTVNQTPTITDNNSSGTYTLVGACTTTASVDSGWVYVRNALIPAASSTTFTYAIAGDTGGGLNVLKVVGCSQVGAAAVKQQVSVSNIAAATPAPVLRAAPDQNNALVGMAINATAGPILSPPTGWTELVDVTYITPTFSMETCTFQGGIIAGVGQPATVTWGSASGSQFGAIVVELACDLAIYFPVARSPS